MASDSSFDVVSKIDRMELDNAVNQAIREIDTRFDFKNTGAKLELEGEKISIEAGTEERAKATLDVLKDKLVKRGVSLKHIDPAEPALSGKIYKISCPLKEGISTENAKKVASIALPHDWLSWQMQGGKDFANLRWQCTHGADYQPQQQRDQ